IWDESLPRDELPHPGNPAEVEATRTPELEADRRNSGRRRAEDMRPSEKDKMLAGELYDPFDPELAQARERARDLCRDRNATRERDREERRRILKELFGKGGESVWMQPPFF